MGNSSGRPGSLDAFFQKYKKNQVSPHTHKDLEEGICHGMCLDWIRLMLHGRGEQFKTLTTSSSADVVSRVLLVQSSTHKLFLEAVQQVNEDVARRQEALAARSHVRVERGAALQAQLQQYGQMDKALSIVLQSGVLDDGDTGRLATFRQGIVPSMQGVLAQMQANHAEILKIEAANARLSRIVADDKLRYDQWFHTFQKLYAERIKEDVGFTDVRYGASLDSGDPSKSIIWFSKILSCIKLLKRGECALLNFRRAKGGHFVAFHFDGAQYHFLDPNAGWYCVDTDQAVAELFHDLWHAAYRDLVYTQSEWRVFLRG